MNPTTMPPKSPRYPGVAPFTQAQKDLFFGREQDVERLYNLVLKEAQVLLYAKSGLGKSSLINAGLLPKLEKEASDDFVPIKIRLGAYVEGKSLSPVENIIQQSPALRGETLLDKIIAQENSLWYHFKSLALQAGDKPPRYLLVLDQFEELFGYPEAEIFTFKKQMADLLYSVVPKTFRLVLEKKQKTQPDLLRPAEKLALNQSQQIKVLMAIREDRYSQMNQLTDYLPDAMHHRYALRPLNREQATAAIVQPAQQAGDYSSEAFRFSTEALTRILDYLSREGSQTIETTQLQILCSRLEELGLAEITPRDIPDFEDIFLEFYHDNVQQIAEPHRYATRVFIENELVKKEQRISLDRLVCEDYLPGGVLDELVNRHLLRAERNSLGGASLELAHDTLIEPVMQAKASREAEEQKAKAEQDRLEEERRLREQLEQEQKEKALRQKQLGRTRILLAFAVVALLIAIIGGVYARQQQLAANRAKEQAEAQKAQLKKLVDAFYFYDDKFALAYGEIEYIKRFYFINKQGDPVAKLGQWDKAEPFDIRGFAKVQQYGKDYLLDTLGTRYLLATSLEALDEQTRALDLSRQKLDSLPAQLGNYPALQVLLLEGNQLRELPPSIKVLSNLQSLILYDNQLSSLPKEIGQLSNLQELNLSFNQLTSLPKEIGQLANLQSLILGGNQLSSLPTKIGKQTN